MRFLIISVTAILSSLFPISSSASCAGLKDCNPCYDSLLGAEKEDVSCQTDDECIAILHRCGDFYFLNKARSKKYIDTNLKPDESKKVPRLECKFHNGWKAKVCQPKQ